MINNDGCGVIQICLIQFHKNFSWYYLDITDNFILLQYSSYNTFFSRKSDKKPDNILIIKFSLRKEASSPFLHANSSKWTIKKFIVCR